MTRYWFEFNLAYYPSLPPGIRMGCGVTAFNYEDALNIIQDKIFNHHTMAPIVNVITGIDLSTLDKDHILSNAGLPNVRGIWFPLGYS